MDKQQWLDARKRGLGSTDVIVALGHSKWKTPHELWLEKTGLAPGFQGNRLTDYGLELEPIVQALYEKTVGRTLTKFEYEIRYGSPNVFASIDCVDGDKIVEIKTVGAEAFKRWGDGIPTEYYVQGQVQMYCWGVKEMDYAVMVRDTGELHIFGAKLGDGTALIMKQAQEWWNLHVGEGLPPQKKVIDFAASTEVVIGSSVEATAEITMLHQLIKKWRDTIKEAEMELEALTDKVKMFMGDNDTVSSNGKKLFTWATRVVKSLDKKSLQNDHPGIIEKYETNKVSRTFLFKDLK